VWSIPTVQPPGPLPDLRRGHRRLAVEKAQRQSPADRRGAITPALLDPLVDSIGTAAGLSGVNRCTHRQTVTWSTVTPCLASSSSTSRQDRP
jgi:hypothetical protein